MTRETKIGLLVGLGFIVVFAVLLSHTGTQPPPGESVSPILVEKSPSNTPVLDGGRFHEIAPPSAVAEETPAPQTRPEIEPTPAVTRTPDALVNSGNLTDILPAPVALNPGKALEVADATSSRTGLPLAAESPAAIVPSGRKAPEVVPAPQPTVRTDPPVTSEAPTGTSTVEVAKVQPKDQPKDPGKSAPSLKAGPSKEYVVQKRDTLTTIAEKQYGSSSPRIMQVIAKSNNLKNANSVIEGQKLVIPNLPPEMFENVASLDVTTASGRGSATNMQEVIDGLNRKAPKSSTDSAKSSGTGTAGSPRSSSTPSTPTPGTTSGRPSNSGAALNKASSFPGVKLTGDSAASIDLGELTPVENTGTPKTVGKEETPKDRPAKSGASAGKDAKSDKSAKADKTDKTDKADKSDKTDKTDKAKSGKDSKPARESKPVTEPTKALAEKGDQVYRYYEVKPNDTLAGIAKQELGAGVRWEDIKKLNGGVDPRKMKPGDKIKLPRKSQSSATDTGRVSA